MQETCSLGRDAQVLGCKPQNSPGFHQELASENEALEQILLEENALAANLSDGGTLNPEP